MSERLDSVCSEIKISLPRVHSLKCHMHTSRVQVQTLYVYYDLYCDCTHRSIFCHTHTYAHTHFPLE